MSETEKEYECKKCHEKFIGLDVFRGHNLRCQVITKDEIPNEPEIQASRSETRERVVEERKERVPLGVIRRRLSFAERRGFKRRWMNDKGSRISDADAGGYTFVTNEQGIAGDDKTSDQGMGKRICKTVGTNEDGTPTKAYLMEIREDWYEQDQKKKMEYLDMVEAQLQRGQAAANAGAVDGKYVPRSGGTQIVKGD